MSGFKGTQGNWIIDPSSRMIKCNGHGIASAWTPREVDEEMLNGESWLSMRQRTRGERDSIDLEKESNLNLIVCSPELLDALIIARKMLSINPTFANIEVVSRINRVINKALKTY